MHIPLIVVALFGPFTLIAAHQSSFEHSNLLEKNLADALKDVDHNNLVDFDLIKRAWHEMDDRYREHMQIKINRSREHVNQLFRESSASKSCRLAVNHLFDSVAKTEFWAMQMWKSWGNFPPTGFFEGSLTDLGLFDICLNIQDNKLIGQPKYCTLDFRPVVPTRPRFHSFLKRVLELNSKTRNLFRGDHEGFIADHDAAGSAINSHQAPSVRYRTSIQRQQYHTTPGVGLESSLFEEFAKIGQLFYYGNIRIGSCWPSKCSQADIEALARSAGVRSVLQVAPIHCVSKSEHNSFDLNKYQIVALVILGGWFGLVLLASCLDLLIYSLNLIDLTSLSTVLVNKLYSYLEVYSLQRNFSKLFTSMPPPLQKLSSKEDDEIRQLPCLNGIKILSMIWIIYGHTLLLQDYQSFTHGFKSLFDHMLNIFALPGLNTNFSVDTFFVISGLLSTYVILSLNIKFNALLFTVVRYMRLTPQLVIAILLFFLLPLMGNGPLYKQSTELHANRCYKNYWLNLLYLQSYINRPEMCMIPSWWLSIEMTFHILSMPVVYMLIKRPKIGFLLAFGIALNLTLIGALVHYKNEFAIQYLPTIPQRYEVESEQTQKFFHRPYPHAASYFSGIILGYILGKRCIKKFNGWQLILGWFICLMGFAVTLCGSYYWNLGKPYTQLQATLYYNICQVLWPISICWIILVCSLGQGGFVDDVLSAKSFVPLGRITYMTYLSHMIIVYHQASSVYRVQEPSILHLYHKVFTNIILSLLLGTFASLVYETPIKNLQKILFNRFNRRLDETKPLAKTKSSSKPEASKSDGKNPKFKRKGLVNLNIKS